MKIKSIVALALMTLILISLVRSALKERDRYYMLKVKKRARDIKRFAE